MSMQVHGDSTALDMAPRISKLLDVPVQSYAVGGARIGDVLLLVQQHGAGQDINVRAGHNLELRQGNVPAILDGMAKIAAIPKRCLVWQLSNADDAAYATEGSPYAKVRDAIFRIDSEWAVRYGDWFLPVRDMVIAEFLRRHSSGTLTPKATAEELEDCRRSLYPRRWRAATGNDGHPTPEAKDIEAGFAAARWQELNAGIVPPPAPVPDPPPGPAPVPPPPAPTSTLPAWLQRILDRLRRR